MADQTEAIRRELCKTLNVEPGSREDLEAKYGDVYDTTQLQESFTVLSFCAPFCIVARKSDGVRGSVLFQHNPRFYHSFKPE
ncbi:hypothetical protein LOC67_20105 [Stieleria sp. JC731]|uniref:hypothetical protein n=1 Tax=Pirellulaceae TaxID=2691357 RepID=UPI001E37E549|nr:hypothetical protein [Stieleria sp. JC731]MCC9602860.1 hypothetical protein [Stieleria sp. JC731]